MSQTFSRRDFFAHFASPLTRAAKRVAASEQRVRALHALAQTDAPARCTRCYVPFQPESDEMLCPTCRAAAATHHGLIQSLFKPS